VKPAAIKGGRVKAFILIPQKLAVENKPVEIGISGIGNQNIRNLKYSITEKTRHFGLRNRTTLFFLV
jgi:hypothetical protein